MESTISFSRHCRSVSRWRDVVMPKEHGSWSLAFEPLALGLLIAPSAAGGLLAASVAAGFFARRPLRIAIMDARVGRRADARAVIGGLAALGVLGFAGAIALGGSAWLPWLVPSLLAGVVFAGYDVRSAGREEIAEVTGAAAFAWLPAILAILAGATPLGAVGLAAVMVGRAVPTVLCVRSVLRATKTGERRVLPALLGAGVALSVALLFFRAGAAPFTAVGLLAALALRAIALLVFPRPALRGRTLGMIEAALGVLFVVVLAATWTF